MKREASATRKDGLLEVSNRNLKIKVFFLFECSSGRSLQASDIFSSREVNIAVLKTHDCLLYPHSHSIGTTVNIDVCVSLIKNPDHVDYHKTSIVICENSGPIDVDFMSSLELTEASHYRKP